MHNEEAHISVSAWEETSENSAVGHMVKKKKKNDGFHSSFGTTFSQTFPFVFFE